MPVNSINGFGAELPIRHVAKRPASADVPAAADSFDTTAAFQSVQSRTPESRPEKIAAATALVADENYPSEKALKQLASLLAEKL